MAITVEELVTKWSLNFDGKTLQSIQDRLGKLKDTLAVVATGFAAASAAIAATAKFTSDAGTQIDRISGMTGIATDRVQELAYAFQSLGGLEMDQFSDLMTSFTRRLTEAIKTQEGEAWEGLKLLNFDINRIADSSKRLKDPVDAIYQISDAIAALPTAGEQGLIADQLFEGETEAVINVLRRGSGAIRNFQQEARELGFIMDQSAIKKSIEFRMATNRLMAVLTGLRNTVGVELIPVLSEMIDGTIEWIKQNKELVSSGLIAFSKDMILIIGVLARGFVEVTNAMGWFINAVGGVDKAMRILNITLAGFATAGVIYLASIAAVPLAIGAAILAAAFLIEDFWTFLEGGDSIFGDLVNWVKSLGDKFQAWYETLNPLQKVATELLLFIPKSLYGIFIILSQLPGAIVAVYEKFKEWFEEGRIMIAVFQDAISKIKDSFAEAFDDVKKIVISFLDYMQKNFTVSNMLRFLSSGIDAILPEGFSEDIPGIMQGLSMSELGSPLAFAGGITPQTAPTLQTNGAIQNNQSYQFTFAPQLPPLPQNVSKQEALRTLERNASSKFDDFTQFLRNQAQDNEDTVLK